jgi:hypothetical protein
MYLVHIHLRPLVGDETLPVDTAAVVMSAGREAGFEHVAVHSGHDRNPVIGVYVRATTLAAAEALTEDVWRRLRSSDSRLGRWVPLRVEVPLLRPDGPV